MKRLLTLLLTGLLFLFLPQVGWAQDQTTMITMPGTSIQLPVPDGFHLADGFPGLIHENTATTVYAMEKEGTSYEMIVEAMDRDYFLSQEMTLISKENFRNSTSDGVLFICGFTVDDVKFERAIYVTGNHNNAKVIIANYPEIAKGSLESMMRNVAAKIQF